MIPPSSFLTATKLEVHPGTRVELGRRVEIDHRVITSSRFLRERTFSSHMSLLLLLSTNLRQYVATYVQTFRLSKFLSAFLGSYSREFSITSIMYFSSRIDSSSSMLSEITTQSWVLSQFISLSNCCLKCKSTKRKGNTRVRSQDLFRA